MSRVLFLIPVYNDAPSLTQLVKALEYESRQFPTTRFSILVVDDGSEEDISLHSHWPVTIMQLHRNMGHQKAIALGLSFACKELDFDHILIMDCDGEDRPEDAASLLSKASATNKILLARRSSRQNGWTFLLFYRMYLMVFRMLTGKKIAFGNFMLMPKAYAERLIYHSEIWSHLAGGLLRANLPFELHTTHKGCRYEGKSKMSFNSLLLHGLGAIGVFLDVIATRLLVFSLMMIAGAILAIASIVGIKIFTRLAIPGWTSTVLASMMVVLLQSFLLSLFTVFLFLSSQTQRKFIPAHHYREYIRSINTYWHE